MTFNQLCEEVAEREHRAGSDVNISQIKGPAKIIFDIAFQHPFAFIGLLAAECLKRIKLAKRAGLRKKI